jgi:hypothetical protein
MNRKPRAVSFFLGGRGSVRAGFLGGRGSVRAGHKLRGMKRLGRSLALPSAVEVDKGNNPGCRPGRTKEPRPWQPRRIRRSRRGEADPRSHGREEPVIHRPPLRHWVRRGRHSLRIPNDPAFFCRLIKQQARRWGYILSSDDRATIGGAWNPLGGVDLPASRIYSGARTEPRLAGRKNWPAVPSEGRGSGRAAKGEQHGQSLAFLIPTRVDRA